MFKIFSIVMIAVGAYACMVSLNSLQAISEVNKAISSLGQFGELAKGMMNTAGANPTVLFFAVAIGLLSSGLQIYAGLRGLAVIQGKESINKCKKITFWCIGVMLVSVIVIFASSGMFPWSELFCSVIIPGIYIYIIKNLLTPDEIQKFKNINS